MTARCKKSIKIVLIILLSILVMVTSGIAYVINFVFTPEKLTPIVLGVANESINGDLNMESVEITFFSTFPKFGLRVKQGTLVSRALNDSAFTQKDSLLSFSECVMTVNPIAYLNEKKIVVYNLILKDASVYAYQNAEGKSNWDLAKVSTDTISSTADTTAFNSDIDIQNVELVRANLTFNDRSTDVYARLDSVNLKMNASLSKETSSLKLSFNNKNTLFWQQGELWVRRVATSLETDITIDRVQRKWTFGKTELTINDIKLDAEGTVVRDTVAKTLDVDIRYGLHAPSMETVLGMIPESVVKKAKVSAKGEVVVNGTLKGLYGDRKIPVVTLHIEVKEASAKYDDLPYGIDKLTANFDAYIDLMRNDPSYVNLKIFHFQGAHTDVLADGRVDDLLVDPDISFHTKSTVDLDALAKTFPLQKGVTITGKLNADLQLKCKLSSLRNQDIGRILLKGKLDLNKFQLRDVKKDFDFSGNASFVFNGDKTLHADAEVRQLVLKSPSLSGTLEQMSACITSTNPKDTTRIVSLECSVELKKLKAKSGDSLSIYSGKTSAKFTLQPGKKDPTKPLIGLKLKTDSLYASAFNSKIAMRVAGFGIRAEKVRDSVWDTRGGVGFDKLFCRTPYFGLPIIVSKTSVNLADRVITLKNANVRMGRTKVKANGSIQNLAGALMKNEILRAKLNIESDLVDCNQLINALSFPNDSMEVETDTLSASMQLFILPKNIDFELQTNIKKVTFDQMIFEDVYGAVDIKEQYVYLKDLSMRALGAQMKTVVVYKATEKKRGYAGFDFRIDDINVGRLVEFIPALDTIVPMLRSFKGRVNFDIAAETRLDSMMNVRIPSIRAAIHIKGDSLVLMDGETFAEISKMMMFKNKRENVFDSISVNVTVDDGKVKVYPFLVEIDRYRAAVGGEQGLDMNFNYHISILKSPLPFKAGVNITGTPDKIKFRIGKAKYKDVTNPAYVHQLDSTRMMMENKIIRRFKRITK